MAKKTSGMMILLIILIVVGAFYLYSGKQGAGSTLAIAGVSSSDKCVVTEFPDASCVTGTDCESYLIGFTANEVEPLTAQSIATFKQAGLTFACNTYCQVRKC